MYYLYYLSLLWTQFRLISPFRRSVLYIWNWTAQRRGGGYKIIQHSGEFLYFAIVYCERIIFFWYTPFLFIRLPFASTCCSSFVSDSQCSDILPVIHYRPGSPASSARTHFIDFNVLLFFGIINKDSFNVRNKVTKKQQHQKRMGPQTCLEVSNFGVQIL